MELSIYCRGFTLWVRLGFISNIKMLPVIQSYNLYTNINLHAHCGNLHNFNCFWLSIYIWVLASTLDPSVSKINEALSVNYKLLFILSKNIVPCRSYRYIRDRAFPVTRLPPPIYTKFDVSNDTFGCWQAPWPTLLRK